MECQENQEKQPDFVETHQGELLHQLRVQIYVECRNKQMLKLVIKTEKSNIRVNILKIENYQLFDLLFPYKIN